MPDPIRNAPTGLGEASAASPVTAPMPNLAQPEEARPARPVDRPAERSNEVDSQNDLLERINKLYESATALQREAEEIRNSIERDSREEQPPESMTPEESAAASNALIGL